MIVGTQSIEFVTSCQIYLTSLLMAEICIHEDRGTVVLFVWEVIESRARAPRANFTRRVRGNSRSDLADYSPMSARIDISVVQTRRAAYALLAIGLALPSLIVGTYLWLRAQTSNDALPADGKGLFNYMVFGIVVAIPLLIAAFLKAWDAYSVLPTPRPWPRKLEVAAFLAPLVVLVLLIATLVAIVMAAA